MLLKFASLFFWLIANKRRHRKYNNAICHFISPRNYTIESLRNYSKDLHKYRVISKEIDFIFWIDGDNDFDISGIKIKGYGENYKNLKNYLINQNPKKVILSCTDDIFVILFIMLFKLIWGTKFLYYNISLLRANEIMIDASKRNFKYKLSSLIIKLTYKMSDVITFTRIMSHEVLYRSGETAFSKYVSADHTIRGNIQDLLQKKEDYKADRNARPTVGLFTRFENMKRSEDAIEAYIKSLPYSNNVPLMIYGNGSELENAKLLYEKDPLLIFQGNIPQTEIIDRMMSNLFILAPHSGGVSIEAGIAGRAIICYGCNAMPEYVVDHLTGLLVDLNNQTEFIESINLLYEDEALRSFLSQNATTFNIERFSKANMERSYKKLSNKLEQII